MLAPILSGIVAGYAPGYTNNAFSILSVKYDWGDKRSLYESIIGSVVVFGFMIGAATGGKVM
jgi:hypothetical protein